MLQRDDMTWVHTSYYVESSQRLYQDFTIKGGSDPNHFIFEINVGKSRIRHTTTLKLNDGFLDRLKSDRR